MSVGDFMPPTASSPKDEKKAIQVKENNESGKEKKGKNSPAMKEIKTKTPDKTTSKSPPIKTKTPQTAYSGTEGFYKIKEEKQNKRKPGVHKRGPSLGQRIKTRTHEISTQLKLKLLGRDEKGRPIRSGKEDQLRGKKLVAIYGLFLVYNLFYIAISNFSEALKPIQNLAYLLTLNFSSDPATHPNPSYIFGIALTFFFIACALLYSIDAVRKIVFKRWYVQILFYIGVFAACYFLASSIFFAGIQMVPFLLILSTLWLLLQSMMYYTSSRGFSTRVETRLVERYSKIRLAFAVFVPLFFVGVILFISWSYRFLWVTLALDITAPYQPTESVEFYSLLMTRVAPAIYLIVILITLFLALEFILSMKRAETRSAGVWDNFTFALMSFFLFIWMIFMVTLFLLLSPETRGILANFFGGGGAETGSTTGFAALIAEFAVSMIFLYLIIRDIGKAFGWRVFFLQKDGLVFFFLAIIMGQGISRYAIFKGIEPQYTQGETILGTILTSDRLIIPMLLIILLGLTVLIYYIRPQKASMFMRREQEAVEEEDRAKDLVLKFLRREFIRKGKKFRVDSIDQRLAELLNVPVAVVNELIAHITGEYVDIILDEETTPEGKIKYIDFIPITERYQNSEQADEKARHVLAQRLAGSLQAKSGDKQRVIVRPKQKDTKAGELISGLQSGLAKQAREKKEAGQSSKTVDFKGDVKEDTLAILSEFLRNEFIHQVKRPNQFPSPGLKILDIASRVEDISGVNPAELQSALETLMHKNPNIIIVDNPQDADNKIIEIQPITDLELSDIVEQYNPEALQRLRAHLWNALIIATRMKREKTIEPTRTSDVEYNPVITQMLHNLQRMWTDKKHPRLIKWDHTKLYSFIVKLTSKRATGWKEYVATGRTRKAGKK